MRGGHSRGLCGRRLPSGSHRSGARAGSRPSWGVIEQQIVRTGERCFQLGQRQTLGCAWSSPAHAARSPRWTRTPRGRVPSHCVRCRRTGKAAAGYSSGQNAIHDWSQMGHPSREIKRSLRPVRNGKDQALVSGRPRKRAPDPVFSLSPRERAEVRGWSDFRHPTAMRDRGSLLRLPIRPLPGPRRRSTRRSRPRRGPCRSGPWRPAGS